MKFAAALLAATASATSMAGKFLEHVATTGLTLPTVDDYNMRRALFEEVDAFINLHNASNSSFTLGHNQFSTMTEQEKANTRGLLGTEYFNAVEPTYLEPTNLAAIDWRDQGLVNDIQDQKTCGSCWAFSTIASLEAAWAKSSGELLKLSEQQLVDCSKLNNGCGGGSMQLGFMYFESNEAVAESDYPYTAKDGTC